MAGLIVHEWIATHGGSENVVETMMRAFPGTHLACLWNDAPARFGKAQVTESWLARTALRKRKMLAMPFMPLVWSRMKLPDFDWLLISSHLFAHQAAAHAVERGAPAFVYTHTPARYLWEPELDQRSDQFLAKLGSSILRKVDRSRVVTNASFAANSQFVADRMSRTWGVDARVIYPPVAIDRLQLAGDWRQQLNLEDSITIDRLPNSFILGASRFVPYKRVERAIAVGEACQHPVVIAGDGPHLAYLREMADRATVPVHLVIRPSDELLYALYQKAMLFVFPPIEDFGIMPVEAMSLGTPVLVNEIGGAAESARAIRGGVAMPAADDPGELRQSIDLALSLDMTEAIRNSRSFSEQAFARTMQAWILSTQ